MFQPQRILHPTDYSGYSTFALDVAADLARKYHARLLILHVAETLGPANVTYGEISDSLEPEGYQRRVMADLKRQVPNPPGVDAEYVLGEGDPAPEIARIAAARHCDLIVMGTHAPHGILERLFMGTVTDAVLRQAPCPVLVTKATAVPIQGIAS